MNAYSNPLHRLKPLASRLSAIAICATLLSACSGQGPDKLLEQARTAIDKSDSKTAEIHLKNLLQQQPENSEARVLLASVHSANRDEVSAEKEWRRALESGISPDRALPGLMASLVNSGRAKEALEAAAKYTINEAQPRAEVAYWSARAHLEANQPAKADAALKQALELKPDYLPAQVAQIQRQVARGDAAGARKAVDNLLSKAPALVDALLLKSDLQLAAGEFWAARDTLTAAIEAEPRGLPARVKLIALLSEQKDVEGAEAQFSELAKFAPNLPVTLFLRALLDFRSNKTDAAATAIQQALRASPEYVPALALAANISMAQNSLEQAESYARQVTNLAPDAIQGTRMLAAVHLRRNDYDKALQVAKTKIDRGIEDPTLLAIAGEAALRRNDIPTATDYLARAAKLDPKDPNKRTVLGLAGLAGGNAQMGFSELQTAVDLDADATQADLALITERLRAKQYDQALAAVERLEKKQGEKALPHNLRGTVLLGKGDKAAARASFEKALSLEPGFFPAAANLAQLDLADKKDDAAKNRFSALLKSDPKNVQALVALAQLTSRTGGSSEEVTRLLNQAQEINPSAIEPLIALAQQQVQAGKPRDAIPLVQRAVAQQPDNVQLLDALGTLYLRADEKQQAIDTFEKIVRLYPNSAPLHLRLGEIKASLGDTNGALTSFKQAAELDRKAPGPQFGIAAMLLKDGKKDEALKVAKTLQQQLPNSAVGLSLEGDLLATDKKWAEAAVLYKKAIAVERSGTLVSRLHNSLKQAGRGTEAEAALREGLQAAPNDLALRMYAGEQAMAANQWKAAIEHYQVVVKAAPGNVAALNNLAWSMNEAKDPRALEVAEQAMTLAPQSAAVIDTVGIILLEKGDSKRAVELLKRAAGLAPKAADIRFHYAQALAKSGDKTAARTEAKAIEQELPEAPQLAAVREFARKL